MFTLEITDLSISLVTNLTGNIRAFVKIIFNDMIYVNARILEGENGLFLVYPSYKNAEGWRKSFLIINREVDEEIKQEILNAYDLQTKNATAKIA